jgi:cytochrome c556
MCRRIRVGPVAATLVLLGAGCGESKPRYSLQQVMFQMQYEQQALEQSLERPQDALERARALRRWSQDPAHEAYAETRGFRGDPAEFTRLREAYHQELDSVIGAAETGDTRALVPAYNRMRAACERCHLKFRPGM